jgi:hypothetical protein
VIHEERCERKGNTWYEVWRDDAETVCCLRPDDAQECRAIQNEVARWKCSKDAAFLFKKKETK